MSTPILFWLFTLAVYLIQAVLAYAELPQTVVTHFNMQGSPDGFGSKDDLYLGLAFAALLINIWPPLISFIMRKLPAGWVNFPNKEYWYATPDRKTRATSIMVGLTAIIMGLINLIFIAVLQQIINVTLDQAPAIPFWTIWVLLLVVIILPIAYMACAFRVKQDEPPLGTGR
jgi:uncharacterized membrane protein